MGTIGFNPDTTDFEVSGKVITPSGELATTAFATSQDLGVDQTWQDVTASRSVGVTYTNTTGKPIMVSVVVGGNGSNILVDGIIVVASYTAISEERLGTQLIIPNGSTYSVAGANTPSKWLELR